MYGNCVSDAGPVQQLTSPRIVSFIHFLSLTRRYSGMKGNPPDSSIRQYDVDVDVTIPLEFCAETVPP